MPAAVSGQDGSGATLAVARAAWHGWGLDDAEALALLCEYNARCLPPWTERELRHKLDSVKRYPHPAPRGHLRGETGRLPSPSPRSRPATPEVATWIVERRSSPTPPAVPPVPAPPVASPPGPPSAVPVPGCLTPRPATVNLPDADWRAVEAVGMADEPLVLAALAMFGPGCRVVGSEVGE